jgi:hypothetical protein
MGDEWIWAAVSWPTMVFASAICRIARLIAPL